MTKIEHMEKALQLSMEHLSKADTFAALTVLQACVCQVVAYLKKEDMDAVSDPDLILHFEEDCGDEEEEA